MKKNINSTQKQKITNEMDSDTKWINSIKESANANTVKIFFSRDASLVYQQSLLAIIYMLDKQKKSQDKAHISFFVDEDVFNLNKFNFDLFYKNKNYVDKFSVYKNNSEIPGECSLNEPYKIFPTNLMVRNIFIYYLKKFGDEVKFDIWIPDLSFTELWRLKYDSFFDMLPHINKIYILSDGNYQTYSIVEVYLERINHILLSRKQINEEISILRSKDKKMQNKRKEIYAKSSSLDYFRCEHFITIFHIIRYTDSPFYKLKDTLMYKAYRFNFDYVDIAYKLYVGKITKQKYFISFYEQFFRIKNNSLSSFVYKGFEHYDPKKKNIIWIGDSLIRQKNHVNEARTNELRNAFINLTNKYNPNDYNYFFKHHPFYSSCEQVKLTNFIAPHFEKPIYFSNFPWELFLAWDKVYAKNNLNYISFFGIDKNKEKIAQTTLVGIQYTSSTILSTYSFLKSQYNLNEVDIFKSIDFKNFLIPQTFDVIETGFPSQKRQKKQKRINKLKIDAIYEPFLKMRIFTEYKKSWKWSLKFLQVGFLRIPYNFVFRLLKYLKWKSKQIIVKFFWFITKKKKNVW